MKHRKILEKLKKKNLYHLKRSLDYMFGIQKLYMLEINLK
jgi:hypothetical protein